VTTGDVLVFGLGWQSNNPPSTPTDTLGDNFQLGVSNSINVQSWGNNGSHTYACSGDPCGQSLGTVTQGDILVAERTDPGWIMLFPACAGLLVERGSLLSHSAIVAREMALPAIVALSGVTTWLKDGDWVEMNGASGVVRRVPPPTAQEVRHAE